MLDDQAKVEGTNIHEGEQAQMAYTQRMMMMMVMMMMMTTTTMLMYVGLLVMCILFLSNFYQNRNKYKFSRKSVLWQCSCSVWRDRRTEMTRLLVAFRNCFAKAREMPTQKKKGKCFFFIFDVLYTVHHLTISI